jgi:hypothetical protein
MKKSCNRNAVFVGWSLLPVIALLGTAFGTNDRDNDRHERAKTLYVWAGDQARVAPDFLAVIDFDEESKDYGKVLRTVPIPPPGNVSNEAHHCHLSADNKDPRMRRPAEPASRTERHFLLRRLRCAASQVPVLREHVAIQHHRRLSAFGKRWISDHADGICVWW